MISTANRLRYQQLRQRGQQSRCRRQVLRAQLGFIPKKSSADRPVVCQGCANYHGKAYGTSRQHRVSLICCFHPYGWAGTVPCPDWRSP